MKKVLLAAATFLALGASAHAEEMVYETSLGSAAVYNVSVTTSAVVRVDLPPNRFVKTRHSVELYNDDATDTLHCSFDANVSTSSTDATAARYGRPIKPGASWTVQVPDFIPIYCLVEGTGAGTAVTALVVITQL